MGSFATNYEEIAAVLLFVIGMSNLVFQPNLLKKIIGLDIMDSAVYLFLAAKGYIEGRTAPIVVDGILDASHYINPVPAGSGTYRNCCICQCQCVDDGVDCLSLQRMTIPLTSMRL